MELAIKESIAKGLLNDIKECLTNLNYLNNKSTKKLRSSKKLIGELDRFVDLTDNFIEDDGVAPIVTHGTRWIGYLVKALQVAINKFAIHSTDLENIGRKGEKSENKDVKSRLEDDSHKDILQAAYKVLNSWTVIEEGPKENMTGFGCGCETEHVEENSDNGNDERSDDDNG